LDQPPAGTHSALELAPMIEDKSKSRSVDGISGSGVSTARGGLSASGSGSSSGAVSVSVAVCSGRLRVCAVRIRPDVRLSNRQTR
jgi:hypothetical protein